VLLDRLHAEDDQTRSSLLRKFEDLLGGLALFRLTFRLTPEFGFGGNRHMQAVQQACRTVFRSSTNRDLDGVKHVQQR